jgi:hypothetical protein
MVRTTSSAARKKEAHDAFPHNDRKSKGQWFLVSAVMATGVFLVISMLFRSYSAVDTSESARVTEDYYFNNVKQQFSNAVAASTCADMDANLREYRAFAQRELNSLGYRLYLDYTINDCAIPDVSVGLLVASSRFMVYENVDPASLGLA